MIPNCIAACTQSTSRLQLTTHTPLLSLNAFARVKLALQTPRKSRLPGDPCLSLSTRARPQLSLLPNIYRWESLPLPWKSTRVRRLCQKHFPNLFRCRRNNWGMTSCSLRLYLLMNTRRKNTWTRPWTRTMTAWPAPLPPTPSHRYQIQPNLTASTTALPHTDTSLTDHQRHTRTPPTSTQRTMAHASLHPQMPTLLRGTATTIPAERHTSANRTRGLAHRWDGTRPQRAAPAQTHTKTNNGAHNNSRKQSRMPVWSSRSAWSETRKSERPV